jgi:pimeloyl-ACP methyl ester carboxylesterase
VPRLSLNDGDEAFAVTLLEPAAPSRAVLFSVGGGGDPERHLPLLSALAGRGCTVVAPHFARLASPIPTDVELELRARRLHLALAAVAPELPAAGVGHSIGAAMLLALAGAEMWTLSGRRVAVAPARRIERLALLAPATGFFQAPGALDAVAVPILAWAGSADTITPPAHAELLARAHVPVDVRIANGAGHFSFMNVPPPGASEPLANRDGFLAELTSEICRFVAG